MKIGVWHFTGLGGARRHLYEHVRGLIALGHEVISVCPDATPRDHLDLGEITREIRLPLGDRFDGMRFKRMGSWNWAAELNGVMEDHCRDAAGIFDKEGIDVLLAAKCSRVASPSIAAHIRVPSVLYIQDPWRSYYEAIPRSAWAYPGELENLALFSRTGVMARWQDFVENRNRRIFVAREIKHAALFSLRLVNSYYSRESVWKAYGLDARVCYIGVNTSMFRPASAEREPILLGVGTYHGHKNISFILRSIAKSTCSWPLVWIGNEVRAGQVERYRAEAAQLNVDFRPVISATDADLVAWYNRASLCLCAPRLEPYGLTPLEANACGLPVLATREGGLRETVEDGVNGLLVDEDEVIFSQALVRLMNDATLRGELGARGLERVNKAWGLEQSVERLEAYLKSVLN